MPADDDPTRTSPPSGVDLALDTTVAGPSAGPADALPEGTAIGRYVLGTLLGRGGMGVVHAARDPQLDRDLAIKLVPADARGARPQARLLDEARTMARLRHPNVVPVFDVGTYAGGVYVVMPLLEGGTLHDWLAASRRPWREVLDRFVAAGRGLAAAHAVGVIHRDFKPRNVLVGAAGEVQVADFGIAAQATLPPISDVTSARAEVTSAAGTPAYMAPEQARSDRIDARADQYSFCISLWEGLHGERPHDAETRTASALAPSGVPPVPADRRGAPAWLLAALARGFAADPARRWPSMDGLLRHIDRRLARPRRFALGAAGLLVAGAAATAAVLISTPAAADPCPDPVAPVASVWNPQVRAAVEQAVAATKVPYAADALRRIVARLDGQATAWRLAHVAACRDNRAGRQSDAMLALRMTCLDRSLTELQGTIAIATSVVDRQSVQRAIAAADQVAPLADCADTERLGRAQPPPHQRAEVDAILDEAQRLRLARRDAKLTDLAPRTTAMVARARSLGHAPTLALVLREQADLSMRLDQPGSTRLVLEELAQVAAEAGDDVGAAYAWVQLMKLLGSDLAMPAESERLMPVARAAVARVGNRIDLRVMLLHHEASVIDDRDPPAALARLREARTVLEQAGADDPQSVHAVRLFAVLGSIAAAQAAANDFDQAVASHRITIGFGERVFGGEHPEVGNAHTNLSQTLARARRFEDSLAEARRAAEIVEKNVGEAPPLVQAWKRVGAALLELERTDEAMTWLERALALAEKVMPREAPEYASVLADHGQALRRVGRFREALARYDDVIALHEATKRSGRSVALAIHNRAGVWSELHEFARAIPDYQRAIAMFETIAGGERIMAGSLVGLGQAYVLGGHPAKAIAPLERALAIKVQGINQELMEGGRWMLGRARVEARRDPARGLREVKEARAALVAMKGDPGYIADIDAWLAKH